MLKIDAEGTYVAVIGLFFGGVTLTVSGIYTPIQELSCWAEVASMFSPLTHTIELAKYALGGETFFSAFVNIAISTIYTTTFRLHIINQRK